MSPTVTDLALRLAVRQGWAYYGPTEGNPRGTFGLGSSEGQQLWRVAIPDAKARLPVKLAFVGEIVEALGTDYWRLKVDELRAGQYLLRLYPRVCNKRGIVETSDTDLVLAMIRAALEATK